MLVRGLEAMSVTFIAPPSGKVKITYSGYVANTAAAGNSGNAALGLAWSGGLTRDPNDLESIQARASTVGGVFSRSWAHAVRSKVRNRESAVAAVDMRLIAYTAFLPPFPLSPFPFPFALRH